MGKEAKMKLKGWHIAIAVVAILSFFVTYTTYLSPQPEPVEASDNIWFVHLIHPVKARFPDGTLHTVYSIGIHSSPIWLFKEGVITAKPNLDSVFGEKIIIPLHNIRSIDKIDNIAAIN